MLTLARYRDESIIITTTEGRIEVTIQRVHNNGKVQLGIEAPRHIEVHRKEIQIAIDRERKQTDGAITNMPSKTH